MAFKEGTLDEHVNAFRSIREKHADLDTLIGMGP